MEQILYRHNPWWEPGWQMESLHQRGRYLAALEKSLASRDIVMLTGLRRIGKTTLMQLLIDRMIKEGLAGARHICYVSLDDYLLSRSSLPEIIEAYRKIHGFSHREKVWLFLDEVTYLPDYEQQLKNVYDGQRAKVFASSSSASLLKSKKSHLVGRHRVMEILPLDFGEYLEFSGIKISKADRHLTESHFEQYLATGGIPEYVLRREPAYLRELADDIIHKDIAALHGIKALQQLKDFFLLLMERSGKVFSINKLANILSISPDTAGRYLELFSGSYLIHLVTRQGKTNARLLAPKKIYAADLGIRNQFTGFRDLGSLFENYIYLKLRHLEPRYLYQDGVELDFLTGQGLLIEAKYNSAMTAKQQELFRRTPAKDKMVINGPHDLNLLDGLQALW
jgi:predicted AAA+ superfamily ATPase